MTLYTIGYEGSDIDRFLKALKYFKISAVIDVRKLAFSRKKDFCKNSLSAKLTSHRIEYFDFSNLGTSKELRHELQETGNYEAFFQEYRKFLQHNIHLLNDIKAFIDNGRDVALLCFEKDNDKCHRKVIAEEIRKMNGNGLKIVPIRY
jgi:uncharacterized protein (DUF488 family)